MGRQRPHAVVPLLTPSQDEIAVQLAAGAMTARIAAATGDLIDTALDQGGAGQGNFESFAQPLQNFEQFLAQAAEFLVLPQISLHVYMQ